LEAKKNKIEKATIEYFILLGEQFNNPESKFTIQLNQVIDFIKQDNQWFTNESVRKSIAAWAELLNEKNLRSWLDNYSNIENNNPKTVAIIMAGNIPLVGFHDLLCVLVSGNKALVKPSSDDKILLNLVITSLIEINPTLQHKIEIVDGAIKNIDAIIATGSNNSARYFDYYFGKYPHIIRKNRNSIAILNGAETESDLKNLGKDVFTYYGLGCRNVSKLFVPVDYNFNSFFEAIFEFGEVINHNKYGNNYEYNRAVYLMNSIPLLDNNFLLLKQDESLSSPIGVLFYEFYSDLEELKNKLKDNSEKIQCVVCNKNINFTNSINFGESQQPGLIDYADGVDVMKFLTKLN
jgi:hypothetical protein